MTRAASWAHDPTALRNRAAEYETNATRSPLFPHLWRDKASILIRMAQRIEAARADR